MRRLGYILLLSIIILLAGCKQAGIATQQLDVTPAAPPNTGSATLTGRIVTDSGDGSANTIVRLADVVHQGGEGVYVLDMAFSPGARTDQNGYFIFENIKPLEYVIIVGDAYDAYKVISGDDGKAKVFTTTVDQILDVGQFTIDLSHP
jgi:hypothetical protein